MIKNLAQKSVARLPSYGLTCQMILESLAVVQTQLGEKLSETQGFTLLEARQITDSIYTVNSEYYKEWTDGLPTSPLTANCE